MAELPRTSDEDWPALEELYSIKKKRNQSLYKRLLPGDLERMNQILPLAQIYADLKKWNHSFIDEVILYAAKIKDWDFLRSVANDLDNPIITKLSFWDDPEIDQYLIDSIPADQLILSAIRTKNPRFLQVVLSPAHELTEDEIVLFQEEFTPATYQIMLDHGVKITHEMLNNLNFSQAEAINFLLNEVNPDNVEGGDIIVLFNEMEQNIYAHIHNEEELQTLLQRGVFVREDTLYQMTSNGNDALALRLLKTMTPENINPAEHVTINQMFVYRNDEEGDTGILNYVSNPDLAKWALNEIDPADQIRLTSGSRTPLHSQVNHPEILRLLLETDELAQLVNLKDKNKHTALDLAKNPESIRLLLGVGAYADDLINGTTILQRKPDDPRILAYLDHVQAFNLPELKDIVTWVNYRKNAKAKTVLMLTSNKEIAIRLLQAGAFLNVRIHSRSHGNYLSYQLSLADIPEVVRAAQPENFMDGEEAEDYLTEAVYIEGATHTSLLESVTTKEGLSIYLKMGVDVIQSINLFAAFGEAKQYDLLNYLLDEVTEKNLNEPLIDVLNKPLRWNHKPHPLIYYIYDLATILHLIRLGVQIDHFLPDFPTRLIFNVTPDTLIPILSSLKAVNFKYVKSLQEFINLPSNQLIEIKEDELKVNVPVYLLNIHYSPESVRYLLKEGAYLDSPKMHLFSRRMTSEGAKIIFEESTAANFSTDQTMVDLLNQRDVLYDSYPVLAQEDDLELTQLYLENGASPFIRDGKDQSLIHYAFAQMKAEKNLNYLKMLDNTLSSEDLTKLINLPNEEGFIIFPFPGRDETNEGDEFLAFLLDHGGIIDGDQEGEDTTVLDTILVGEEGIAQARLQIFFDHVTEQNFSQVKDMAEYLNRPGSNNDVPLISAASHIQLNLFKSLLEHGARPNGDVLGALAESDNLEGFQLIETDFPELIQKYDDTLLPLTNDPKLALYLIEHGAPLITENGDAVSLRNADVFFAVVDLAPEDWINRPVKGKPAIVNYTEMPEVIRYLVEQGVSLETLDQYGNTPLAYDATLVTIMTQANLPTMSLQELIDHQNNKGMTILMDYAYSGYSADLIRPLLQLGAAIDLQDNEGRTALMYALAGRNPGVAAMLLDKEEDWVFAGDSLDDYINASTAEGRTALLDAVEYIGILDTLLGFNAIADRLYQGKTPLQWAAESGRRASVELLTGPDLNLTHFPDYRSYLDSADPEGNTALLLGLKKKSKEVVISLLAAGASVDIPDADGNLPWANSVGLKVDESLFFEPDVHLANMTYLEYLNYSTPTMSPPLHAAIYGKLIKTSFLLLDQGASVALKDADGNNALIVLAAVRPSPNFSIDKWRQMFQKITKAMKKQEVDINTQNAAGYHALSIALLVKQPVEIITMLLAAKSDPNLLDAQQDVPLSKVLDDVYYSYLLEYGADPNYAPNGYYPLAAALQNVSEKGVSILLAFGADPNQTDFLSIACQNKDKESFNLLLSYGARLPAYPEEATLSCLANSEYPEGEPEEVVNEENHTRLMDAIIRHKKSEVIQRLIKESPDIDVRDIWGRTALYNAVRMNNYQAVQLLLAAGANPLIDDIDGLNSLELAEDPTRSNEADIKISPDIYEAIAYYVSLSQLPEVEGQVVYQPGGRFAQEAERQFKKETPFECDGSESREELEERLDNLGLQVAQFTDLSDAEICAYLKWYNVSAFVLPYEAEVANMCLSATPREELVQLATSFGLEESQFRDKSKEQICAYLKRYTQVVLRSDQTYRPTFERTPFVDPSRIKPLPVRTLSDKMLAFLQSNVTSYFRLQGKEPTEEEFEAELQRRIKKWRAKSIRQPAAAPRPAPFVLPDNE